MERQRGQPCLFIILTSCSGHGRPLPRTHCNHLARFSSFAVEEALERWTNLWSPKVLSADNDPRIIAHHQWMKPSLCIIPQDHSWSLFLWNCELMLRFMSAPQKASMKHFMGYQTDPGVAPELLLSSHTIAVIQLEGKAWAQRPSPPETGSTWAMDMGVTTLTITV